MSNAAVEEKEHLANIILTASRMAPHKLFDI
jgi:hypothetical protein